MNVLASLVILVALILGSSQARAVGPSFDCSKAATTEQHIICSDPALSRSEMEFIQAYYALRQEVGSGGWEALKREDLIFLAHASDLCGISNSAPLPADMPTLAHCLSQAFTSQRNVWLSRLSRPASEEARRPVEQHVALQRVLQQQGYLPSTEIIDGVYGAATRAAILNWQKSSGREETGFIDDSDAHDLLASNTNQPILLAGKSYHIQYGTIGCRDPQTLRKFMNAAPAPQAGELSAVQLPAGYCARISSLNSWNLVALQADLAIVKSGGDLGPPSSFYVPAAALFEPVGYQAAGTSPATTPVPVAVNQDASTSAANSEQPSPHEEGTGVSTSNATMSSRTDLGRSSAAVAGQSSPAQLRTASSPTSATPGGNIASSDDGSGLLIGLVVVALAISAFVVARLYLAHQRRVRALAIARKEIDQQASRLRIRRIQTIQQDPYGTVIVKRWQEEKEYFVATRILRLLSSAGVQDCYSGNVASQIEALIEEASLREVRTTGADHVLSYVSNPETFDPRMDPVDYERYCAIQLRATGWNTRPTPATGDQGADIIAERADIVLVAQCKLYSSPIGNKAVQEVIAARTFYAASVAIVVSNAPYTPAARQLALASG